MTERENALRVILRTGEPEWIPSLPRAFDLCLPTDVVRERPPVPQIEGLDWFGCKWVLDLPTLGYAPIEEPLVCTDITKWREQITFPDLEAIDWEKAYETTSKWDRENRVSYLIWESGCWERLHAMVGFQNALTALYEEPEAVHELMDAIADFKVKVVEKIAKYYKPDVLTVFDDLGHQRGPFMSNEMFREFILPYDKRVGDAIRAHGIIYCQHSCGNIDGLFDDMMDMEPQIILGLFAPYNDRAAVMKKHGHHVCIDGDFNSQLWSNPNATDEELIADIKETIDIHAPYKNLILATSVSDPRRLALLQSVLDTYGVEKWSQPRQG